jgi:hypothetical protein
MSGEALLSIAKAWSQRAEEHRSWGNPAAAKALDHCASELRNLATSVQPTLLNLTEASRVSGFSTRTLQRHVSEDKLKNRGRRNAPRFYDSDLPKKAGASLTSRNRQENMEAIVRSVVNKREVRDGQQT